jgi:hypothetical protein
VPRDPLELEQNQLVELAVLVALVRRTRQLRFQLCDSRGAVVGHGVARQSITSRMKRGNAS